MSAFTRTLRRILAAEDVKPKPDLLRESRAREYAAESAGTWPASSAVRDPEPAPGFGVRLDFTFGPSLPASARRDGIMHDGETADHRYCRPCGVKWYGGPDCWAPGHGRQR